MDVKVKLVGFRYWRRVHIVSYPQDLREECPATYMVAIFSFMNFCKDDLGFIVFKKPKIGPAAKFLYKVSSMILNLEALIMKVLRYKS